MQHPIRSQVANEAMRTAQKALTHPDSVAAYYLYRSARMAWGFAYGVPIGTLAARIPVYPDSTPNVGPYAQRNPFLTC